MKMLSWEAPLQQQLQQLRAQEAAHLVKMARIRGCNMAFFFFISPLVAFVTFAVYRWAQGGVHAGVRVCVHVCVCGGAMVLFPVLTYVSRLGVLAARAHVACGGGKWVC